MDDDLTNLLACIHGMLRGLLATDSLNKTQKEMAAQYVNQIADRLWPDGEWGRAA